MTEHTSYILNHITTEDALVQLAEEAAELSQAALKLHRNITGKNQARKTYQDCCEALEEELTDVSLAAQIVSGKTGLHTDLALYKAKAERWAKSLGD